MLEFTTGDMFAVKADALVNPVNCVGAAGAGLALEFKKRYPVMHGSYVQACKVRDVRVGEMWVWHPSGLATPKEPARPWVINFPTKDDWRKPSEYQYILGGLLALRTYLERHPGITVGMPALGCGNGGLDWDVVKPMIEVVLMRIGARVMVFEPQERG